MTRFAWLTLFYLTLGSTLCQASTFPFGFNPTSGPFIDQCLDLNDKQCRSNKACTWTTAKVPQCMLTARIKVRPPDIWRNEAVDLVTKFFTFEFGMHLTDGKTERRYYNTDVNECAALCLKSASGLSDWMAETPAEENSTISRRRCLSFDFYPFEMPMELPPHSESMTRGICSLNAETRATARLRPEDSAFSDAELFYISQPLLRPFSRLDGYYEVRDQRGTGMASILDFGSDVFASAKTPPAWGQSRNGITYIQQPKHLDSDLDCKDQIGARRGEDDSTRTFFGGFTPTNRDNSCPGLISKTAAANMCKEAGGSLCPTQQIVRQLDGTRLGCNFDGQAIWAHEDEETSANMKKYVRCCANFVDPPDCGLYSRANTDFCTSKSSSKDCIGQGTGYNVQVSKGYGRLLEDYRSRCALAVTLGIVSNCRQLLMQPWQARDRCVWCPGSSKDVGQCRPGNSFGICQVTNSNLRQWFAQKVGSYCPQAQLCDLVSRQGYHDLSDLFASQASEKTLAPTAGLPGVTRSPTVRPTAAQNNNSGVTCLIPCRQVKGNKARQRCKGRSDCKWHRQKGTVFKSCIPK